MSAWDHGFRIKVRVAARKKARVNARDRLLIEMAEALLDAPMTPTNTKKLDAALKALKKAMSK